MNLIRAGILFSWVIGLSGHCYALEFSDDYKHVRKALEVNADKIETIGYKYQYSKMMVLGKGFFQGSEIWGKNSENLGIDDFEITSTTENGTITVQDRTHHIIIELDRKELFGQSPKGIKSMNYRIDDDSVISILSPEFAVHKSIALAKDDKPVLANHIEVSSTTEVIKDLLIDVAVMPEILYNARIRSFNYHLENMADTTVPLFSKRYMAPDGDIVLLDERPLPPTSTSVPSQLLVRQTWKIDAATSMPVAKNFFVQNTKTLQIQNYSLAKYEWIKVNEVLLPSAVTVEVANVDSIIPIEEITTLLNPTLRIQMKLINGTATVKKYESGKTRIPVLNSR